MRPVVRHSVRALLMQGDQLVLFRRVRPGRDPHHATIGGGVEPDDPDLLGALHREVREEIGGELGHVVHVHDLPVDRPEGIEMQHVFVAELLSYDLSVRSGPEFSDPSRGTYDLVHVPFTPADLEPLAIRPPVLAEYLLPRAPALRTLLDGARPATSSPATVPPETAPPAAAADVAVP